MPKTLLLAALCSGLLATAAIADGKHHCPPPRPPKEAIDACDQKAAGDDCSFETPDGTLNGTCFKPDDAPADAPLACAPPEAQR